MKTTRFLKVWTICLAGLLATSNIGCERDGLPTATTIGAIPQKPSTLTGIYWVRARNIYRANADGTEVENIYSDVHGGARSIALDVAAVKIYWTGSHRGVGKIRRADLVGTNEEDILTDLGEPRALALDVAGGKIYWGESGDDGKIRRATLQGTRVKNIVIGMRRAPKDIALDVAGGKIYWCTDGSISRANLDGINVQVIIITHVEAIDLDLAGGKIYWTDGREDGKILRANLNGTDIEDILTELKSPRALALDVAGGKIYWAEKDTPGIGGPTKIRRGNLDGTNVEDIIIQHRLGAVPYSIALAPR